MANREKLLNRLSWYVVYTRPRWEKKVESLLVENGVEAYLPLRKTLMQWSDRKKWVEEPLFKSYVFVRIKYKSYFDVLNVLGVVAFVRFSEGPAIIQNQQIEAVKMYLTQDFIPEEGKIMQIGTLVTVTKGPLMGLNGKLVNFKGKHRVLIELEAINEAFLITIPKSHLKEV